MWALSIGQGMGVRGRLEMDMGVTHLSGLAVVVISGVDVDVGGVWRWC